VQQQRHALTGLGSSDAHHEDVLGVCFTEFEDRIRDRRDLVEAIHGRRATAHDRAALTA
jgi:hypothetical protein